MLHETSAGPPRAISLDHGNVWASWEPGKLRGPGGGQPSRSEVAALSAHKWKSLKPPEVTRWLQESKWTDAQCGEINISFRWAEGWISRNGASRLARTSRLSYNLPEVPPRQHHVSCTWHARGCARRITNRRRGKCGQFEEEKDCEFLVICSAHCTVAGVVGVCMLHISCMKSTQNSSWHFAATH